MSLKMKKVSLLAAIPFISLAVSAQDILQKDAAVKIALENNYDIRIAKNDLAVAGNNASLMNSGYLPSVSGTAGANYSNNDTEFEFNNGEKQTIDKAENKSYNASVALDYTIFDGTGRMYTYKRLKENYNLSELQARQVIENSLVTLFTSYYEVARLTENLNNQLQTLEVSQRRLKRAQYNFDYGQGTQLDVLNSKVDVNNDSITFLNTRQQLANAKRDLNVILGQDVNIDVRVDTNVIYSQGLTKDEVMKIAMDNNVSLVQAQKNIDISEFDIKVNQAGWMPRLTANSSYGWNRSDNGASANQIATSTQIGLSAGLTLSWNIFDGGSTNVRVQNAKITKENQNIRKEQLIQQVTRDIANQWEVYQNALFVMQARATNLQTNQLNFKRSQEQYNLGQVTSIEFRQAQLNLLNASTSYNQAKYDAKLAELRLLQLEGKIIGAQY